jgi:hypothetical protein
VSFAGYYAAKIKFLLEEGQAETTNTATLSLPSTLDFNQFNLSELSLEALQGKDLSLQDLLCGTAGGADHMDTGRMHQFQW